MTTHLKASYFFAAIIFALFVFSIPVFVHAGAAANAMCSEPGMCQYGTNCGPNNSPPPGVLNKPCKDTEPGGVTIGHCVAPQKCHGDSYSGGGVSGGGTDAGLGQLGQILGQLLGKLMSPSPSSPPPGGGAPTDGTTPKTGCQGATFDTSDITQLSNPCARYVAPVGPITFGTTTGTTTCDTLSQLLGSCGSGSSCPSTATTCTDGFVAVSQSGVDDNGCQLKDQCVLDTNNNTNNNSNSDNQNQGGNRNPTVNTVVAATGTVQNTGISLSGIGMPLLLAPGAQNGLGGDIFFSGSGATIFGASKNNNTGVAGFFGSDTFGGAQPQGLAAQMCQSRPWATGFLSSVLPTAFFDGLCTARGYQVGTPPAPASTTPVVQLQQTPPAKKPAATSTTTPAVKPQVQIWAVPASVPLATRASIFWNTQGVTDCTETSPDGSFNQNSLSGGAATVPLTGATTFTISCLDTAGNPVTGFVTVNISI